MRLFKCGGNSDDFWPLDDNETVTTTTANLESEPAEYSGKVILDLGSPRKLIM